MRSIAFGHWVTRYTDKSLGFRDPFLSERVFAVEYWYKDSMNDVWGYYEALLPPLGWQKVRELVPAEQTLCGGDWVGVYRKEKMMFKLHACGEDPLPSDLDLSKSEYKGKFLTYYFYKTKPEDVLGRNYNKRRIQLERTTDSDECFFGKRGRLGTARGRSVPALEEQFDRSSRRFLAPR